MIVLEGRSSGIQDITDVPEHFVNLYTSTDAFSVVGAKIAQSASVLSNSLVLNPIFSASYQLLSISPLRSLVNGFSTVLFSD